MGDKIAIVWEKSGSDENATYKVVDVLGDYSLVTNIHIIHEIEIPQKECG